MVNSLVFNNKDSYKDLDLLFVETPAVPISIENTENISVEGRNGTLTRKLGTFNDKVIKVQFRLNTKDEKYYRKIDEIILWLTNVGNKNMTFSFDKERKYVVKSVTGVESIQRQLEWYGDFEVQFICDSFKYPISDDTIITTQKTIVLYNNGTYKSEPYIKITGSGNITLSVNGKTIILNSISEYIELDSMYFLCKKGLTNQMSKMNGDFPIFQVGKNEIEITGNVTNVEIQIRVRYL
jgi:predicted phage tail component-like protein